MNRDGQALLDDLGLTNQHITFLGDVQVRDEDEIGRGSDAVVYKVNWQGIDIALKVLHPVLVEPGVQDRERKLRAFGQEVFRLSRTHHPNLCQLIGLARVRGNAALALELLSASLEDVSIGDGREDTPKLVSYLCDASAGLRYLHSFGIIHRDLAPKNVLVKNGTAKVSDFGVAKFVCLTSPRQQPHQVRSAMEMTRCPGTLPFMAPEALSEAPDYDRPLDMFSLGVMMLSVLTGVMPGMDVVAAPQFVVVRERGQEVQEVIPETTRRARYLARLPDEHPLKPLIRRCLSNCPGDRPSAEQAHEEIKGFLTMFNSILPSQPSAAATGLTRQLESISQQLSQQATCIADITTRSSAVEDQLSTIVQRLGDTQLETTSIRGQLRTTSQQVTGVSNRLETTSQQVTGMRDCLQTTNQQVTEMRGCLQTTNQQVTEMHDCLQTTNQQMTETRAQVTSQEGHAAVVATQLTDLRAAISEQFNATNRSVNDQLSQLRSTLQVSAGSDTGSGRTASLVGTSGRHTFSAGSMANRTTDMSSVGENSRQHSAAPAARSLALTPGMIQRITRERKWIKVPTRSHCDGGCELINHQNTLVAVWKDRKGIISSIAQTTDMRHWTDLPLPHHSGPFKYPSLASTGQVLYMYCYDNRDQAVLLQYTQRDRQWVEVAKGPNQQHSGCVVHATDTDVSLLGGYNFQPGSLPSPLSPANNVSCYTFSYRQWNSSTANSPSPPPLPCDCRDASLVACHGSLYIIGGSTGCFLQYTGNGHWQQAVKPDGVDLVNSLACSLSDDSLVIASARVTARFWMHTKYSVYNTRTGCVSDLPNLETGGSSLESLAILNGVLLLSSRNGNLYTLDVNPLSLDDVQ
ncbi:probable serine/threonine-protein kinase DDB_G0278901 isoform X3 [Sycon ciliatum]|uniref:probable serine/threonine-protein kinase DDB_G0278901 isoform X3 n=1 Tax=Sycon ciliatum TaxID=27933 RepID=UPI0031F5FD91